MSVIVAKHAWAVELVNRDAPGLAQEELLNDAILHRNYRGPTRRQNIGRLMQFPFATPLLESVSDITGVQALNRQSQLALCEQFVFIACPKIIGGSQTRECETTDRK